MSTAQYKPILPTDILDQATLHANMMRALFGAMKDRDDRGGPEVKVDVDYLISLGQFATTQFEAVYNEMYSEALDSEEAAENRLASISNHINLVDQKCAATDYHIAAKELANYMAHLKMLVKGESHE